MSKEEQLELLIKYCQISARDKSKTAKILFEQKRYVDCLFFCHLSLEMLLKGIYVVKHKKSFPILHDLPKLIEYSGVKLGKRRLKDLGEINSFNISGRYDDYKRSFYNKANQEYSTLYLNKTLDIIKCLKKNLHKKKQGK
jgi:HEPN domain-containing protein